jgi:hypothetical protein
VININLKHVIKYKIFRYYNVREVADFHMGNLSKNKKILVKFLEN